jgi:hypothetical protein
MAPRALPSVPDLRRDIIRHVDEFIALGAKAKKRAFRDNQEYPPWAVTWASWSALGMEIAGDPGLFFRIHKGKNITIETVERIRIWFETNWPKNG